MPSKTIVCFHSSCVVVVLVIRMYACGEWRQWHTVLVRLASTHTPFELKFLN